MLVLWLHKWIKNTLRQVSISSRSFKFSDSMYSTSAFTTSAPELTVTVWFPLTAGETKEEEVFFFCRSSIFSSALSTGGLVKHVLLESSFFLSVPRIVLRSLRAFSDIPVSFSLRSKERNLIKLNNKKYSEQNLFSENEFNVKNEFNNQKQTHKSRSELNDKRHSHENMMHFLNATSPNPKKEILTLLVHWIKVTLSHSQVWFTPSFPSIPKLWYFNNVILLVLNLTYPIKRQI